MGAYLMERMREWPQRFAQSATCAGCGLMIGIELVRDRTTQRARRRTCATPWCELAFERGLLVLGAGETASGSARRWWSRATSAISPWRHSKSA